MRFLPHSLLLHDSNDSLYKCTLDQKSEHLCRMLKHLVSLRKISSLANPATTKHPPNFFHLFGKICTPPKPLKFRDSVFMLATLLPLRTTVVRIQRAWVRCLYRRRLAFVMGWHERLGAGSRGLKRALEVGGVGRMILRR